MQTASSELLLNCISAVELRSVFSRSPQILQHLDDRLSVCLSVYSVCLLCLSPLSVYSVCLLCLSPLSVSSVCLLCLSPLSVSSVCLLCLSTLSVYSVCLLCLSTLSVYSVYSVCLSVSSVCLSVCLIDRVKPIDICFLF